MRLGLLFLSLILFSDLVLAEAYSCEPLRQCSPSKDPLISYAIDSCQQQIKAANCEDFYKEDPEYEKFKRSCDPYEICKEKSQHDKKGQSCDKAFEELLEDNVKAVKSLKNLMTLQFWKDLPENMRLENLQLAATDLMEKKHREYACLNEFYRQRMLCYGIFLTLESAAGGFLLKSATKGITGKFFRRSKTARK